VLPAPPNGASAAAPARWLTQRAKIFSEVVCLGTYSMTANRTIREDVVAHRRRGVAWRGLYLLLLLFALKAAWLASQRNISVATLIVSGARNGGGGGAAGA